jgi:hypothetical protein
MNGLQGLGGKGSPLQVLSRLAQVVAHVFEPDQSGRIEYCPVAAVALLAVSKGSGDRIGGPGDGLEDDLGSLSAVRGAMGTPRLWRLPSPRLP